MSHTRSADSPHRTWFLALFLLGALPSCGSDGSDSGGSAAGSLACNEGEFELRGTLDGHALSAAGTVQNHLWENFGSTNKLDASFDPPSAIHAQWPQSVFDGQTTEITGAVTLPAGTPHGGETLDASGGHLVINGDTVNFDYSGLSLSVMCVTAPCPGTPVSGSLEGCLHWQNIGP